MSIETITTASDNQELSITDITSQVDYIINNNGLKRGVTPIRTSKSFFNSIDINSIQSVEGFLTYYNRLSEVEVNTLKQLLRCMNAGLLIYVDDILNREKSRSKFTITTLNHEDEFDFELPCSKGLEYFVYSFSENKVHCEATLEGLLHYANKVNPTLST